MKSTIISTDQPHSSVFENMFTVWQLYPDRRLLLAVEQAFEDGLITEEEALAQFHYFRTDEARQELIDHLKPICWRRGFANLRPSYEDELTVYRLHGSIWYV